MSSIAAVSAPVPAGARSDFSRLMILSAAMLAATAIGSIFLWNFEHYWLMHIVAAQTLVYAVAVWLVIKAQSGALTASRRAVLLILGVAALMRLVIIAAPPVSTDIYRYIWDGRTQAHGINPYAYIPADPALAAQRDPGIYPKINRRETTKTIYPPMAQIVFLIATRVGESVTVMKLAMVLFEVLTVWALLRLLARRGLAPGRVLLYAWNPLVVWEFAGSGHTEAVGIAFMTTAMLAADSGRRFLSGVALGAAALSKFFPLASTPAIYRRWDWRMPAGLALSMALLYAPYIGAGLGALGSVDVYAKEVGADTGKAFFILDWINQLVPLADWSQKAYLAICGALLVGAGLVVIMRRDPQRAAPVAALVLMTAFQIVMSPHYPWYLTWAVPFLCFRISPAVIWLTGTASLLYEFFTPLGPWLYAAVWVPFFVLAAIELFFALRHRSFPL